MMYEWSISVPQSLYNAFQELRLCSNLEMHPIFMLYPIHWLFFWAIALILQYILGVHVCTLYTLCDIYQLFTSTCKLYELPPGTSKGLHHFVQDKKYIGIKILVSEKSYPKGVFLLRKFLMGLAVESFNCHI